MADENDYTVEPVDDPFIDDGGDDSGEESSGGGGSSSSDVKDGGEEGVNDEPISRPPEQQEPITRPPEQEEPITRPPEQEEPISRPPEDDVDFGGGGGSSRDSDSSDQLLPGDEVSSRPPPEDDGISDGGQEGINDEPISRPPEQEEPITRPPQQQEPEPGSAADEAVEPNRITEPPGQDVPSAQQQIRSTREKREEVEQRIDELRESDQQFRIDGETVTNAEAADRLQETAQELEQREQALTTFQGRISQSPRVSSNQQDTTTVRERTRNTLQAADQPSRSNIEGATGRFFDPTQQVDPDLDFSEEAVVAGADIIRQSEQFAEENLPETRATGRTDLFTQGARTVTAAEELVQGDTGEAAAAFSPAVTTEAERENIRTLETGAVQGPGTLAGFAIGGGGAVATSIEENAEPVEIGTAFATEGITGASTELAFSTQEDIEQGAPIIASQAAEDPGEFALEETGEEIGEGIATGGIGLLTPTITPTITPETTINPAEGTVSNLRFSQVRTPEGIQTSEVQTGGATAETRTGDNLGEFIPEQASLPDLGEQTIGQSRRNILNEPESQLRGENLVQEQIIGQPQQGREAGVPEEQAGLREEEVQVLEQRRERQPGVERVESEITEFGDAGSEQPTATEVEFTTEDTLTQRFQDTESEDSGLEGVLGGRRKGQTRGIPLIPDQDTSTTPESGFDQTRTGRVETESVDTEISIIESRETPETIDSTPQQPETQANSLEQSLGIGLTPTLEQGQEPATGQTQNQGQQPFDIPAEVEDVQQAQPQQFEEPTPELALEQTPRVQQTTRTDPMLEPTIIDETTPTLSTTPMPEGDEQGTDTFDTGEDAGRGFEFAPDISSVISGRTVTEEQARERGLLDEEFTGLERRPIIIEGNGNNEGNEQNLDNLF